jgi:hypothetical protein
MFGKTWDSVTPLRKETQIRSAILLIRGPSGDQQKTDGEQTPGYGVFIEEVHTEKKN